jgi:hypothetical protein
MALRPGSGSQSNAPPGRVPPRWPSAGEEHVIDEAGLGVVAVELAPNGGAGHSKCGRLTPTRPALLRDARFLEDQQQADLAVMLLT